MTSCSLVDKYQHWWITYHCHVLKPNVWDDSPDTGNGNHFPYGCDYHFQPGNSCFVHHHLKLLCFQPKYVSCTILLILFNVYFLFLLAYPLYFHAVTFISVAALCVTAPVTTTISSLSVHSHCQFPISEPHFVILGWLFCCEIFNKASCHLSYIYLCECRAKIINTD